MLERRNAPRTPAEARYAFDYDDVEPPAPAKRAPRDLSPEDRLALGLTAPRMLHSVPEIGGDAAAALHEVLLRGGAVGKDPRKR